MLRKITPYTKLLPSHLTALIVLFSLCFVYSGSATLTKNTSSFTKFDSLKEYSTSTTFISQKKCKSSLPEELPVTIEEQEENTDDDKNNDALTIGWNHYGQNHIPELSTTVYIHHLTDCPQPLPVPLYILFHSWKNFIC